MKLTRGEPTFLAVRWEVEAARPEQAGIVVFEATLCHAHRRQIWDQYPNTWGCGRLGDSCDLCEARTPHRV
ncbi:MAG: hypothetical protein ACRDJF_05285 [Actinomycetota bacterium]